MKKLLSLLLAVMMVISLCPITALADDMNQLDLSQTVEMEEQQEEPLPEQPEQPAEEPQEEQQQSEMNTLDLTGGAAPLAEGSANGDYYTENGAVIAFDANGISGCNYTVDNTSHSLYIQNTGINRNVTVPKTYIVRMHSSDFSIKNNGSASVKLQNANRKQPVDVLEAGEQKAVADLPNIKQVKLATLTTAKYDITNAAEVYYMYIDSIGDGNLNAAILIEIIPNSVRLNGSEFATEKTELTGWNRIKSDGSTERVECADIYMLTLPYGDESISLDWLNVAKYAGQALGSEMAEAGSLNFAELFANSDYAVTGDNKAAGVSCTALFGDKLPGTLSDRDKVVFIAGYDAEGNAKAGVIARVYVPDTAVAEIATAEDLVAFRDYVNAGNTEKNAKLVADIDLSTVCGKDIGNWTPIASYAGTFDGNNHTISNFYIEENDNYASLFDTIEANGTVKNLGMVSATINRTAKSSKAAAIVCRKNEGTITGCYVKDSTINSFGGRGSLFCDTNRGTISDCYVINGTVNDQGNGLYGRTFAVTNTNNSTVSGTITNCYAVNVKVITTKSVKDSFIGTTTTANAGVSNCYVLDTDNQTTVNATVKTAEWFKSDEAVAALGDAWQKDADNKNGGFPVLKSQKSSGSDKPTGKNNGIFTVQLEDGTEVYPEKLAIPETFDYKGNTYTFDDKDGHWKITVPEGTKNIKVKLDNLSITEGLVLDEHCHIGAHGNGQGGSSGGVQEYKFSVIKPVYCTQTALDNRLTTVKFAKPRQAIIDASVVDAYEDGWFTLPLESFIYNDKDWMKPYGELDSKYQWAEIIIGFVDLASTSNAKSNPWYQAAILVQIGEQEEGENTPPVRRSNVAASISMCTDDNLKCEINLSKVFYDADGDALTYKVRVGEEGEYVPFEGSTYTHTLTDWSGETLYFTANDGKTDGGSYIVKLNISRDVLIAICEAIIADPSDYWTENDRWDGETYTVAERYKKFVQELNGYKTAGSSESYYKNRLIEAYKKLMPKSKVNASSLYMEAVHNRIKDTSVYTDVSVPPYLEALAAVDALYAEGAIANEPYTAEKQAEIERVAAECAAAKKALVWKDSYKKAFEYYQKNKDEAKKLLELYDPAKYTESDYTADSWQAFVAAWNDLKADVDFVFDEESGTAREWNMLQNFEKHMKALPQKFSELVSAVDITVSFKYIENMHFRYEAATVGTDGYYNGAMTLKAGETTVMDAVNISGRTLYTFASGAAQVEEGRNQWNEGLVERPFYALFINGIYVTSGDLNGKSSRDYIGEYQLHNGDEVVIARITPQFTGGEASSGYDTTTWYYSAALKPEGIENSVGLINITSVTQNAKVGDSVTIKANAKTAHATNLNKKLNAEGLTLLISEPSEENVVSQNWKKTVFTTNANGAIDYVFAESGYYTVAIVNNKYDEPTLTNVYGVTTIGTYNTLMIGDFTTVYIAPADDPDALIAEWREKNLAEAKAYFEQFKYYDFNDGYYEDTLVPMYKALVENQKNAKTFKELVNSYNNDFVALQDAISKNLRDHDAIVAELRRYLRYIPEDLSEINYSYSNVVSAIQRIYGGNANQQGMNDYEKNLLSDKERELVEKLMLLDANNLPTGKNVTVDVQKDANMVLAGGYGWLASAPNENCVYKFVVSYGKSQKYYKWTTGTASEPSDEGMTAYPGDYVHARRLVVTSDDAYWMVFSYDGGNTWNLSTKVDGGEGMFSADFVMPETDADTLVFAFKMVSKTEYEEMKLNAETPEMALEEAQAAYKAALEEAFATYDRDRYTAENYTTLRYAKEDGITNIDKAKTVTAVVNYFNIALEAMKAVPQKAQVYVEVKNETFTEAYVDDDGNTITPPWTGTLVAEWVNLKDDSTMMSCIVEALANHGYVAAGAENNYISDINGLGEFGGGSGSGWMGTLNDWFTNYGFGEFSVANGTLKAGDRISVMYTCTLGSDIGGAVEGNTDTTLKALSANNGTLAPDFDKETMSYLFTMDEGKHTVTLNYTASNKAFQVRTYLNQYTPSSDDYYACGETISVKEGDIIYVACGDPAWPSMAGNDALKIIPHVYAITVVGSTGAVEELIKALPAPEKLVYSDKGDVENAKRLFDALSDEKKAEISEELQNKLEKCVARMADLEKVHAVEELIAALPAKLPISDEERVKVNEAKEAFDALGEELQKDVKSVYTNKLLSLLGQQKIYFDYQGGKENTKLLFTQKDGKLAVLPGTTKENYHFDGWYTEKDGGTQISLETIFTESCKLYAHWLDNAQYAEKLISAIGEVELTDECKARIDAAREAYDKLPDADKELVLNYETLTNAEAKYAELLAQKNAVEELINAIGKVELTDECKAKIDAARAAYDKLTDAQKKAVGNYGTLTAAEAEYDRLVADKAAAKAVDDMVSKLQPITLESGSALEEARRAYDALTPEQKKLLDPETEGKLVAAENEYKKLVKEDADKKAAKEVEDKIAALQPVTKDSGEAIKDARSSYEALTPEQKDLVSNDALKALEKAEKAYGMIVDSNKPDASDKGDKSDSGVIKITVKGDSKGEQNPNTGAPAMSIAPAMLVLAVAALVLKKRG